MLKNADIASLNLLKKRFPTARSRIPLQPHAHLAPDDCTDSDKTHRLLRLASGDGGDPDAMARLG